MGKVRPLGERYSWGLLVRKIALGIKAQGDSGQITADTPTTKAQEIDLDGLNPSRPVDTHTSACAGKLHTYNSSPIAVRNACRGSLCCPINPCPMALGLCSQPVGIAVADQLLDTSGYVVATDGLL